MGFLDRGQIRLSAARHGIPREPRPVGPDTFLAWGIVIGVVAMVILIGMLIGLFI